MTTTPDNPHYADTDFAQSFDARDWAEAFCRRFKIVSWGPETDDSDPEGLMVGWFANAIMRGWDEHARRVSDD